MSFIFAAILFAAWKRYIKSGRIYKSEVSLSGKTVLITGGSSGLGKEVAIGLAKRHARVIIASRDEMKGDKAVSKIQEESDSKNVLYMRLDLSDLDNVREFVGRFLKNESRLDILINGAGVMSWERTEDRKHGLMFVTNVLGPFLLTNLFLPLMEKTGVKSPTRIVNVSSDAYLVADVDLVKLDPFFNDKSSILSTLGYYATTKLMMIYLNTELAKVLRIRNNEDLVTTYALHPGTAQTKLGQDFVANKPIFKFFRVLIMKFLAKSPYFCAQGLLYCSMEPQIEHHSGEYFSDFRVVTLFPHAKKPDVGRRLWRELERLCGLS